MKQQYLDYVHYTKWANNRLISDLERTDLQLLDSDMGSSFLSIRETVKHIWLGEEGWLSRLQGGPWATPRLDACSGTAAELFVGWQRTTSALVDFVQSADLEELVHFEHEGRVYDIPAREIVQTVCNHGSYHRGQVVTMLRQQGVSEVSQTDYIRWVRDLILENQD